ncbi:formyltransferase family protein [Reichenbachiella sp.]|uniref:formyltransferase family protein n=1 Tax=Reichenbachiella sp. TaxID=2184521 RepID=UPI003B5A0928
MNTVTLYLMTIKGFEVLSALISSGYQSHISAVIYGKDMNIENDYSREIINACQKSKINCYKRTSVFKVTSQYSIAVSWRWMIKEANSKLIVFHDSLLPKYRGFAPLVNTLISGNNKIGVSAIYASSEYDKGEVISQLHRSITYPIKIGEAIGLITPLYVELAQHIIGKLASDEDLKSTVQVEKEATYSLWRDELDYLIDWNSNSRNILNFINALSSPYKGASTFVDGFAMIRIIDAVTVDDVVIENRCQQVGKQIFVQDDLPVIVCGEGLLKITKAIKEDTGESAIPFSNFRIRLSNRRTLR